MRRFLLLTQLILCFSLSAFADRYYSPQTSNSISSGGSYCQGATASSINFTYNTCVSGSGGVAYGNTMNIYWYRNSINSTSGGTLVSSTSGTSAVAATGVVSYVPSTTNAGTFYYYCIISYTATGTCGTGGTVTSATTTQVVVLAPPGPITGTTIVSPSATASLSDSASGGTWSTSASSIASVNASTGVLRGVATGSATITYTTGCGSPVTTTAYVISAITWYQDNEGDGWGNPLVTTTAAGKPAGYVQNSQDANDANSNLSAWYNIGSAAFAFSGGSVNTTNNLIAYDNNNVPYVYYLLNTSNSWVMKYTGGAWSVVGGTSFTGNVPYASMAFNSANSLYVAYQDGYNASCKRFNGTSWVQVGSANFTANGATYESLAIDGADVPYMAYRDGSVSNKASVMKFNGTSWVQVGSTGFSAGGALYTTIATDLSNNLYVAYADEANSSKVTVMKYNGSSWSVVGSVGFSAGTASYVSLAIDRTGTPYVAYNDAGNSNKATVMRFNGTSWVTVGSAGFSNGTANYTKIVIDGAGSPYVSYTDASYSNKAIVMKFNGTSWAPVVNSTGITPGSASYLSIALNNEGVPGIFYQDGASPNKGSAMYLAPVKVLPTQPVITATPALSCSGTTVTLTVASGSLNDATAWVWYKGSCGGTYVGTGTTITQSVSSTTNYYCRGENNYFTTQGDCGYAKVTIKATPTWYRDADGDGWGNASVSLTQCTQPAGYVLNNSDCTDGSTTNTVAYNYGNAGISGSTATYNNLLFDDNNIPYIYFKNNNTSSSVYKYTSGTWTAVGSTGFTGNVNYGSMAINSTGNLYVAYQDGFQGSCKRYNGTDWEQVGPANFTPGGATYTSLAIDNSDVPYLAFVDAYFAVSGRATVMKYNGAAWVLVGAEGFTSGTASFTSLAIDAAGSLYVAYQDGANSSKATVMKYAAGVWSILGSAGFSDGTASNIAIDVDDNGTPYVLYTDNNYSSKAIVKKYDGSAWVNVGASTGVSTGATSYNSIKLDAGGNPYISYTDAGISNKASVMKYNGSSWVSVSTTAGFTPGTSSHSSLALDANGIPYLAVQDANISSRATVYKAAPVSVNPTTPTISASSTSITCGTTITLTATGTLNNATAWKWYTDTTGSTASIGTGATFTVTPITTGTRYYARGEGPCLTNQGYFGTSAAITVIGGVTAPSDITGTTPICRASTTTFTSSTGGTWSTSNAAIASVNASSGVVTGVSAGTATITYTVTAVGCGSSSKTKSITVVRTPSIITGTSAVCVGGLTALADSVSGGTWSSSNTGVATITSTTGVVSGASAGTSNISYSLTNACGTNAVGLAVTVNAVPTVASITATPTGYCIGGGGSITLTAGTATGTGTLASYNWSGPLGYSTTSATPSASFTPTNSLSSGYYQVTVTYPGSACTSAPATSSYVTVSPNPNVYSVTGATGCSYPGITVGLSGSQTGINYQLYLGSTASGSTVPGTGSALNFGLKSVAGTYTVSAIGSASCNANMSGSASVITAPALFTLNGGTACVSTGVTITLSGSESGISYQLYRGASTVGTAVSGTGSSLSFGFQNTVGTYFVIATGTGGCSDTMNGRANVVSSLPAYNITGGTGCTYTLGTTVGLDNSQAGVSYQLYNGAFTAGAPVTGTGSAISFGLQATAGTYTATATAGGCTAQNMTGSATVYSSPASFNVMGGTGCISPGVTITLNSSATGVSYQLYRGASTVGSPVAGTNSSISFGLQTTPGVYKVVGTGTGGCAVTMNDSVTILNTSSAPGPITGTTTVCAGSQVTLSDTTAGGTWSSGNTAIATVTAAGVVTGVAAGTVNISYSTTSSCGVSSAVAAVTVNARPVINTSGAVGICTGSSATLTATGATTYTWSPATNLSATTGATVVSTATSSINYTVTGTTSGCSATGTTSVTVSARPTVASITASSSTLCYGATLTLTAGSVTGTGTLTSYNWVGPNSYSTTTATNIASQVVNTTSASGFYSVSVTYPGNGCTSNLVATSPSVTVNVAPSVTSITPSSTNLCVGNVLTLTAAGATGTGALTSYNWSGPNSYSVTGTSATTSFTPAVVAAGGNYSLSVTYPGTGCTSPLVVTSPSVTVNALPTVASITSSANTVCIGGQITLTAGAVTGSGTLTSYNWTGPNSYSTTGTSATALVSPSTTLAAGFYSLSVTYPGTGCTSVRVVTSPSVTVNARPTVASITSSATTICTGTALTLTAGSATGVGSLTSYNWSGPNSYSVTGTSATTSFTPAVVAAGGVYSLSVTYPGAGCTSIPVVTSPSVTVNAAPSVTSITPSSTTMCVGTVLTLTATGATGTGTLTSYNWSGPNSYAVTGTSATTSFTPAVVAAGGNYSLSVTYPGTGCTSAVVVTSPSVTVNSLPTVASITSSTNTVCTGSSFTLTSGSTTGTGALTSYNWTGPNSYSTTGTSATTLVSPSATAASGFYSLSVTYPGTGCTSVRVVTSPSVTVNARPTVATITPSSTTLCTGTTLTLTSAAGSGTGTLTSYNWSGPNGYATSGTTTTASLNPAATVGSGFYSVSVTYPGTGCVSAFAVTSSSVTVNALPTISGITASTACIGSTLTLTAGTATGTGTLTSYNWTGPNSYSTTGTATTATLVPSSTAAAGFYSLSVTYPGTGCRSAVAVTSPSVTVNPAIVAGTITGSSVVLVGATSTLSNTTASGGTGAWSSSNTSVATVTTGSTTATVYGVGAGTAVISYTTTNPCGSTGVATITISTQQPPVITGVTPNIAIPGATVTITGNNFNTTAVNNVVYFGATKATVSAASATSLTVTVPIGATYMPVSVLNTANGLSDAADSIFMPVFDNSLFINDSLNFKPAVNFVTTTAASRPYTAAIGDLDGDGKPDMVVNNRDSNTLSVFLNTGTTTGVLNASSFTLYSKLVTLGLPNNVKLSDLDGDGKLDILLAMTGSNSMSVFRNTSASGAPAFAARTDIAIGAVTSVAGVADFDGDGKPDVAITIPAASAIGIVRNTSTVGTISFAAPVGVTVGAVPSGVCIADFDGDGRPDIASANSGFTGSVYSGNTASVARNTSVPGTISFATSATLSAGSGPIDIAAGDIDGDKKPDLVVTNINDNNFSVFRNVASSGTLVTASFSTRVNFATGTLATGIAIADLNGDRKADIVVSNAVGNIALFRNTTTGTTPTFANKVDIYGGSIPTTVTIGDLDGDKYPEVVVGNQGANTISVLKNYPLPYIAPITGTTSVCAAGGTTTLSSATAGGYWRMAGTNATINSSGVVTGVTAGVDTVIYTVVANYDTNSLRKPIVINALPSITLGLNPVVCEGSTAAALPYSSPVGSPTTYSIVWDAAALSAGFTNVTAASLAPSSVALVLPVVVPGTYNATISVNNGCASSGYSFNTTVRAYPSAAITSAPAPCTNYASNITIAGTTGATIHYSVDGGSAMSATLTGGTYAFSTGNISTPHNYTLIDVSNTTCTTTIDTTVTVTPVVMQWLGGTTAHESDWSYATNWGCGTVPAATDDVVIPAGVTYVPVVTASTDVYAKDVTILSAGSLMLSSGATLSVKGTLNNNGSVNGSGKLVMNNSSAQLITGKGVVNNLEINNSNGVTIDTGDHMTIGTTLYVTSGVLFTNDSLELASSDTLVSARIAALPPTGALISGKVTADQYIQAGYRRFRFWSHPFNSNLSLSQIQNYIDVTGTGGAANGFTPTISNAPSAFRLDPYTGNSSLGYDPGWKPFTRINNGAADSNKIHPGQSIRLFFRGAKGEGLGYVFVYTPSAVTVKMTGNVNQGPQTITLAKGSTNPANQEYNMVGNPYASPVDIGTILFNAKQANSITGSAFYVWDPTVAVGGQYITVAIGASTPAPYYLQAYAGFQVRADHDTAKLYFNESNKSSIIDNFLFKTSSDNITMKVYDANYHMWDKLDIQFNDEATENEDRNYDATKPMGTDFAFYSRSAEGRKLAIDARPFAEDKVVPLGVASAYKQDFIIVAENIAAPKGATIYLHDKLLKKYVEMKQGAEYRFTIGDDNATQGDDRFELSMKPAAVATVKGLNVNMTPNPATDDVKINFTSGSAEEVNVRVLDMSGVSIYSQNLGVKQAGVVNVPLSSFAAGIYMVELTQGTQKVTQKLVKE